ncbi:lipopolysaccharide biosynthesis protein [Dactylosporangium sp. CA-233914]|uniref:lipopolysaccharide biosynthesis protein n=1 Tax=Dactylosporangium sp. CA-233914 TaxID=3239934 RepID=UPI003D8DC650
MTVYEGTSAARPDRRIGRAARRHIDLLTNSGSLMGTTVVTSVLGFAYWWVAARAFPADVVGSASAAVSALTLVGTLSMFGMGTLLISELPRLPDPARRWNFILTCLMVATAAAAAGGLIYVALARFAIPGLRHSIGSWPMTLILLLGVVVTATTLVLDDGLLGLMSGPLQLLRNTYFAVAKLILLGALALLPIAARPGHVLVTWVAGGVLSVLLLTFSLRRRGLSAAARPAWSMLRGRLVQALEHNALNLALFVPRTVQPLVVAAVISPAATAAFYTMYMIFSFLTMLPNNLATTLFAAAAGNMAALRAKVRMALLVSVGLGVPACLVLALVAKPVMGLFGPAYASLAGQALAILALTYPLLLFRPLYFAIARVLGRVPRASVFAVVAGVTELAAAWYGGSHDGLTGLALWLAGVWLLQGLWTAPTVLGVALRRPGAWRHAPGRHRQIPAQRRAAE